MPSRDEIVAYARSLVGTPFKHQGRVPGAALDCGGVIECVGRHFEMVPPEFKFEAYDTFPAPAFVLAMLNKFLHKVGGLRVGLPADVILISDSGYAVHLGILSRIASALAVIHSSRVDGGVVEHRIDGAFARLVRGVWRFSGVDD